MGSETKILRDVRLLSFTKQLIHNINIPKYLCRVITRSTSSRESITFCHY